MTFGKQTRRDGRGADRQRGAAYMTRADNSPMLQAALWYADLGYPVFPCAPGQKTPLTGHGLLDATTDAEQIEQWWTQHPDANVALRTDGLVAIDIDGESNPWLADEPDKRAELEKAPTSLTPRGGRQHLFRQPEGRAWRNTASRIAPHVDTRANGGYICVTPSVVNSKPYRWADGPSLHVPPEQLPEPPAWLTELLDTAADGGPTLTACDGTRSDAIPSGQRNDTLARLAGWMRRAGMSATEILAALNRVNIERCTPPLDAREVVRIAHSIARYAPDMISVALVENHYDQDRSPPSSAPMSVMEIMKLHLLRQPVLHGLLRSGETMNVIAPPKTGKALAVDTPILTETGWMTMGELQPGMKVHAGDGSLTEIVAVSEIMHGRPCYRVTCRSGSWVVADEQHQWLVSNKSGSRIVTTGELTGAWGRRWLLPVAGPLERPEQILPLDPWLLGYWLGNGTAASGEITANQADFPELVCVLRSAGFRIGNPHHEHGAVTFTVLDLKSTLHKLGLLHCKHIPEIYLRASRTQRAALLAGLLDADGHAATQRNGSAAIEFTTTEPELFFQVLELVRSLGYKASTSVGRATLRGVDCGHKLRVWFAASRRASPFRLSRRTAALPDRELARRSRYDAIAEVIPVPSVPVRCIQVAHHSGTFLAGRGFMVTHNSWLVLGQAMSIATGRPWLGLYPAERGRVLILDNELHPETIAHRIPQVAAALCIGMDEIAEQIYVHPLRGQLRDILSMSSYFDAIEPGRYAAIILDAMYRFMPAGTDENDNGAMAGIYNRLDAYAERLGCCFIAIHHTTKGNQSAKSVTDVGAGAGSQSRAADAHLVLRPHEQPGAVVLEAVVRSWPPVEPIVLRWEFPAWRPAPDLDPRALRSEKPRRRTDPPDEEPILAAAYWDVESFVETFITSKPQTRLAVLDAASTLGLSRRRAQELLYTAETRGLVHRWGGTGRKPAAFSLIPEPLEDRS